MAGLVGRCDGTDDGACHPGGEDATHGRTRQAGRSPIGDPELEAPL